MTACVAEADRMRGFGVWGGGGVADYLQAAELGSAAGLL